MSAIIGLDLSLTCTGVCILRPDGTRRLEAWETKKMRGHERMAYILDALDAMLNDAERMHDSLRIIIEGPSYGSQGQGHFDIGGLTWLVKHRLWTLGYTYTDVPPSSLKKFATGHGNAKKAEMLATAIRKHGYEGCNDNEADALLLALWGAAQ